MHGEISTVNGEHFLADIMVMSSTRKFARGDKKNYAFFITFSLKFWKIPPPPPPAMLLTFGKLSNPLLFQPPLSQLLIFGKFSNPLLFQRPVYWQPKNMRKRARVFVAKIQCITFLYTFLP